MSSKQNDFTNLDWKVLTIDNSPLLNNVTSMLLSKLSFMNRSIKVLEAESIAEGKKIIQEIDDISVIIIDIMIEQKSKGLEFIKFIKEDLKNQNIRIILRSGYPGALPEKKVVQNYEIDGYISREIFSELQVEIAILTALRAYNQIITTKKTLQSLAGSIAHEMRNPLGVIKLTLNNILKHIPASFKPKMKIAADDLNKITESIDIGLRSIKRTNEIINITLEKIKNQKINRHNFKYLDAQNVIKKAIAEYGYQDNKEKSLIQLMDGNNFTFKGDETLLIFVIFNLLKNSLYYKNNPTKFRIKISFHEDDEFNQIAIEDNGIGISQSNLKSIFKDFDTHGKESGTGLGLPFCHRVMKSFEGKIECESELGKYARFVLSFPKITQEELDESKKLKHISLSEKFSCKIMILDDQLTNLEASKLILESGLKNTQCDIFLDASEAIKLFESDTQLNPNYYDLIITDIQMPNISGIEFASEIRKINNLIPIIAYTSVPLKDLTKESNKSTIDEYLSKPASYDQFLKTISKWTSAELEYDNQDIQRELLTDKKVLLADDETINRIILKRSLEKYGLIIDEVENGEQLYFKYTKSKLNQYDIIISDINMPNLNGAEAVKKIRNFEITNNIHKRIPIIAYSGESDKEQIHQLFRNGVDDYFIKGGDYQKLMKDIAFWISNNREINSRSKINHKNQQVESNSVSPVIFTNNKQENFKDIKTIFAADVTRLILDIQQDVKNNNVTNLYFHTHALKGIAGNVGATELYNYVTQINNLARLNQWPKNPEWKNELEIIAKSSQENIFIDKSPKSNSDNPKKAVI